MTQWMTEEEKERIKKMMEYSSKRINDVFRHSVLKETEEEIGKSIHPTTREEMIRASMGEMDD